VSFEQVVIVEHLVNSVSYRLKQAVIVRMEGREDLGSPLFYVLASLPFAFVTICYPKKSYGGKKSIQVKLLLVFMETKRTRGPRKIRRTDEAFADLKQALEDALAFERGERRGLRVTRIPGSRPPKASAKIQRSDKR